MKLAKYMRNSGLFASNAAAAMLVAGAGLAVAPQASAQSDHMEWQDTEGVHEEEWYDPSDWFDDDFDGVTGADTDYEYDYSWYDYDDEYDYDDDYATYDDDLYDADWWYDADSEMYADSYYDGYYDGYNDDDFGYDWSVDYGDDRSADRRSRGYSEGYYDGYYDAEQGYDSDWTYYIYTVPVDNERRQAQRERQGDETRQRGDRSKMARNDRMSSSEQRKHAMKKDKSRIRGEITRVESLDWNNRPQQLKNHTVVRLTMDNNRRVVVDLGEEAKKSTIKKGDMVTVQGHRKSISGRKLIDANRLSVNGEQLWNSESNQKPERISSRD